MRSARCASRSPTSSSTCVLEVAEYKTSKHPTIEQGLMKGAAWVMSDGGTAWPPCRSPRAAGGIFKNKWIGPMPLPLVDRWVQARDVEGTPHADVPSVVEERTRGGEAMSPHRYFKQEMSRNQTDDNINHTNHDIGN